MANPEIKFPCPVRRLSVVWRKGEWSIASEVRIESMTLPKSHELPASARGVSGFWFEAVDGKERAVYRQVMQDPFAGMEVFDKDGKIRRVKDEHQEIGMEILLPDVAELEALHIYSSTMPSADQKEMRKEETKSERVAAISLRRERGGDHGRR